MNKKELITRLILFLMFSLVAPITYVSIRCGLFKVKNTISLWFIIVLGVALGVVSLIIKYYLDGMKTKYSMLKQILEGVIKVVLPLGFLLVGIIWFKSKLDWITQNVNLIIEVLGVILGCEIIAIVINPLPKWAFENNVEGLVQISDKIFHREENKGEE